MRRMLGRVAIGMGVLVCFAVSLVAGVVVHLDLRLTRQVVAEQVTALLSDVFAGDLVIDRIDHLSLDEVEAVATMRHRGREVIVAERVRASVSPLRMLSERRVAIDTARVDGGRVSLDDSGEGELLLVEAFETAADDDTESSDVEVQIDHIHVGDVRVMRTLEGATEVIVVKRARATLSVDDDVQIDVPEAALIAELSALDAPIHASTRGVVNVAEDVHVNAHVRTAVPMAVMAQPIEGLRGDGDVSLEASAIYRDGSLDAHATAQLESGDGRATASVEVRARERLTGRIVVAVEKLDLASMHVRLPTSRLTATTATTFRSDEMRTLKLDARLLEMVRAESHIALSGSIADEALPAMRLHGTLRGGRIEMDARLVEPGITADVALAAAPLQSDVVHFDVHAPKIDLDALERIALPVSGSGAVRGTGSLTWGERAMGIDAEVSARFHALQADGIAIGGAQLEGEIAGSIEDPAIEASVEARGIDALGRQFERARVAVNGRLARARLSVDVQGGNDPQLSALTATADVQVDPARAAFSANDVQATVVAHGSTLRASARRIATDGAGVAIDDVAVRGLGSAPVELDVAVDDQGLRRLTASARGVSVHRIIRLVDAPRLAGGTVSFDVQLRRAPGGLTGEIALQLADGRWRRLHPISGRIAAEVRGGKLRGEILAEAPPLGRARAELDPVNLRGDPLQAATWREATGTVSLETHLALAGVQEAERAGLLLPLGVRRLTGHVTVNATAHRDRSAEAPAIEVVVAANGVSVSSKGQFLDLLAKRTVGRVLPSFGRVDARIALALSADRPSVVDVELRDRHGVLVTVAAEAEVPYASLFRNDFERLRHAPVATWALDMPIRARADVPNRSLRDLPSAFGFGGMRGVAWASLELEGPLSSPHVTLALRGKNVRGESIGKRVPVSIEVDGDWHASRGNVKAVLATRRGGPFLRGHARVDAKLKALLQDAGAWTASGHVELCRFPLRPFGRYLDNPVTGWLTGNLRVNDLNSADVDYALELAGQDVSLSGEELTALELKIEGDATEVDASVRVAEPGGSAALHAKLPVNIEGLDATYDLERATLEADIDDMSLGHLQPFVEGTLDEIDGRLSARLRLRKARGAWLTGHAKLRDGRLQVASVGDTFTDASARLRFGAKGIVLESLEANNGGGRLTMKGQVQLRGLVPERGEVTVKIDDQEAIPVIISGQHYGDAHGKIDVDAKLVRDGLHIGATFGDFEVQLSRTLPDAVQSLEPSEHIQIGTFVENRFRKIPLSPPESGGRGEDALPIRVDVSLGAGVRLQRGSSLDVVIAGNPSIEVTDRARVRGQLYLRRGKLFVQGKPFTIEKGSITFTGRAPDNPQVVATASWRAPDGTTVFADFTGPVKTGNVTLRSDPPLGKDRVLSLILFGDADAQIAATTEQNAGGNTATSAAGVGGSFVAEGLNEAMRDLTDIDLSARVGTSRVGNPAAQLELQLARRVSLIYAYVLGLPPPGQNPDRNYATIEWRFRHEWTLETSIGDQGSTNVDLRWEHRY